MIGEIKKKSQAIFDNFRRAYDGNNLLDFLFWAQFI